MAVALVACVGVGLLTLADALAPGDGSLDASGRLGWAIRSGDHLHFAVHITAGRLLDVCPCTRRAAATQYYRAHFHAVTPLQRAVVATVPPRSPTDWSTYLFGPLGVGARWLGDGVAWLQGDRPPRQAIVELDDLSVEPERLEIARGTTVVWRNVDLEGDAHTVTADGGAFASDWLEPGESFSHIFTERGDYAYYCQAHGGPGGEGMAGVVRVT